MIKNDRLSYDLLLGLDAIKKFKLIQDDKLRIFQRTKDGKIEPIVNEGTQTDTELPEINFNEYIDVKDFKAEIDHLPENKKIKIKNLIERNSSIFAKSKFDTGRVRDHEARIRLSENKYVTKKPYRCTVADQQEIERQINELLKNDLIEESNSPFASPVTLAFKKEDGRKTRLCIDFRDLNRLVVPESQPFNRIEDILVKSGKCKYYTALDINSAFWAIPIRFKDREKTAFVTQSNHYQWKCLPFGLKVSSAIFQRILSNIIKRNRLDSFCVNYIDDILIFSESFDEHLKHIQSLMDALNKEGFRLKLMKCKFAQHRVKYLGHLLERNKVMPVNDNLRAIKEFKTPICKRDVRKWLGKINFYNKFIENSTKKLEPLHNLLRKDIKFVWSKECDDAFNLVKRYLCSSPVLAIFDPLKETYVQTDGSGIGLGAVLKQPDENGILHPVAYFSKKLSQSQRKRPPIYLECLAIKEAILFWQYWLLDTKFTVITDHKPLENLRTKARIDEPLGELINYLTQYTFDIKYSPGKLNLEADDLSRNPILESFESEEDALKVVNMITMNEISQDQRMIEDELNRSKKVIDEDGIRFKMINDRKRIFVSRQFGKRLIERLHKMYGHIGTVQLLKKIRPYYYFKNLDRLVDEYCGKCDVCIRNKSRRPRRLGLLSKLGPPIRPFQILSIDTIGGFNDGNSAKKYMHLLVDHFTRFAWITTSSKQTANEFIKLIDPVVQQEKVEILLADQYTGLNSKKLKDYLNSHDIHLVFTSVDSADSNGLNERLNQTLVNKIRCKLNSGEIRSWSRIALDAVNEYNNTPHTVTGFEPQYLLYNERPEIVPVELVKRNDLSIDRQTAFDNSMRNFEKNKERIDRLRKRHRFKEGDKVFVQMSSKLNRRKLEEIRNGPFEVIRMVSNSIVEVRCGSRRRDTNMFHIGKLVPANRSEM